MQRDRELADLEAPANCWSKRSRRFHERASGRPILFEGIAKANLKKPGRNPGDDYGTHSRRSIPPVKPSWLHTAVSDNAVAYLIDRQRGADASALLIGWITWELIHDGWASYNRFLKAIHQTPGPSAAALS